MFAFPFFVLQSFEISKLNKETIMLKKHRIHLKKSNKSLNRSQLARNRRLKHIRKHKSYLAARHAIWFMHAEEI